MISPSSLDEALVVKAARPYAVPIAGGTDLLVDMNFGRVRPEAILDLSRVPELKVSDQGGDIVHLGASTTFARIIREGEPGALREAARTIGSPQIRNRATLGGNLGTASPAGDSLPVLFAYDAEVIVGAHRAQPRSIPIERFFAGPRRHVLDDHELILGVRWERVRGPSVFSKIGTRNAMVIAVANLCLAIDTTKRRTRIALGSVGPTVLRAREAERLLDDALHDLWDDPSGVLDAEVVEEVAQAVARSAQPIDDVRATARYRRHACRVLAQRAVGWALAGRAGAVGVGS